MEWKIVRVSFNVGSSNKLHGIKRNNSAPVLLMRHNCTWLWIENWCNILICHHFVLQVRGVGKQNTCALGLAVHHLACIAQPIAYRNWGKCLHLHLWGGEILRKWECHNDTRFGNKCLRVRYADKREEKVEKGREYREHLKLDDGCFNVLYSNSNCIDIWYW